jgi:hypothetical protein
MTVEPWLCNENPNWHQTDGRGCQMPQVISQEPDIGRRPLS